MSVQILAFDTTTQLCSVAIMINNYIYDYSIIAPKMHAEKILPMIHRLLSEVGITLQSLDFVVFDQGPGSFAGIRIGIGVAQGLALGANLPLIGVSSLSVLAQGARRVFSADKVITTIDARMGELYWANYCYNADTFWSCQGNECLVSGVVAQKLICALRGNWYVVGTGWNNCLELKCFTDENDSITLQSSIMYPEAKDMIPLGMNKWNNKVLLSPEQIHPLYLRNEVTKSIEK